MSAIFVPNDIVLLIGASTVILLLLTVDSLQFEDERDGMAGGAITFGADDTDGGSDIAFAHGATTLLKDRKTGPLPRPRRLTWRGGSIVVNL